MGGRHWVESRDLIDHLFKPIEALLVDAVKCQSPHRVLDIGCGAGTSTRAISRHISPGGCATGVDISDIMIEAAQQGAGGDGVGEESAGEANASTAFICADASTYDFDEGSFQMLISRFGIMFFDDPIRAFQNLRRAAARDARALFVAWRSREENPFMTTAARAASPMVTLPEPHPDAPGQFAFADRHRVEAILDAAGWNNIRVVPLDIECTFPVSELVGFFTRLGPLGRVF
ncbi:SAM-dependent methyltransferase, partial [Alcanivorax sp. HI0013]